MMAVDEKDQKSKGHQIIIIHPLVMVNVLINVMSEKDSQKQNLDYLA